jgi:hypothetical protein
MKIACWMIVLVAALGLGGVANADQASTPDAFYGRYQGSGFTHDPNAALFGLGARDLDVEIGPAEGGGFFVSWTTVMQSPGDKGSKTKSSKVVFVPSGRPGIYTGRPEGTTAATDGMSWASIGDRAMTVRLLHILDDGTYEVQTYQRSLTDDGMFVFFRSDLDGAVMKVVTAQLHKAK